MAESSERLARLESEVRAHVKADEVAYARINSDTSEIKQTLRDMASDLKSAVERIHIKIEENAVTARSETSVVSDKVNDQKNWVLTGIATVFLGVIGWFADHFFGGHH